VRVERAHGVRTRDDRAFGARFLFVGLLRMRVAVRYGVAAILAIGGLLIGVLPMTAAHADSGGGLVSLTNSDRASEGLAPLSDDARLAEVAQGQANRMAAAGVLAHNPALSTDVCCWARLGENVGYGGSLQVLNSAFLASPEHRANIMGAYNEVGIGVAVDKRGLVWVSEVFRLTTGATVSATAPVAPKAISAPAAAKPKQVRIPTRTVVVRPKVTVTHAATPAPKSTVVAAAAVPARSVPSAASRSLPTGRLPLAVVTAQSVAQQWAGLLVSAVQLDGADPIASVLSFAAQSAAATPVS
jgi:hypothetical protein